LCPNGAGKTTTIKMLTGLLIPDKGSIEIDSFDIQKEPEKAKMKIGYLPDKPYIYEKLTGNEYL
jgi:ABC-2 type transport system ATP-binding protein